MAIKKHNVGLVVLDSVAANYRAEFDKEGAGKGAAASMARRGTQLVQLGALLREIARTEGIAIVVANQVADRFTKAPFSAYSSSSSNAASRTTSANSQGTARMLSIDGQANDAALHPPLQQDPPLLLSPDPLSLDHQQAWFTGWGDSPYEQLHVQKTPSLGLVWTNQIACRIALKKQPVFATRPLIHTVNGQDEWADQDSHISKWRRWFKLVFAPWAPPSPGRGIEFEIHKSGIRHVSKK